MANLYLIPSPIGNLKEVSPRIIETINLCDFIACEDTRNTKKLLMLLGIKKECISCHEHNEKETSIKLINLILSGKNIGYLSDAGNPCISDPGALLTLEAIKNNITVIPLSGPCAFIDGLIASGIDTTHFLFYGFLLSKSSLRVHELEALKYLPYTLVFYESPHRINETLKDLYKVLGDRKITIARELTKIHEEFIRTNLKAISESTHEFIGEMVLIVDKYENLEDTSIDEEELLKKYNLLIKNGLSSKDAATSISILLGINKNQIKTLTYKNKE